MQGTIIAAKPLPCPFCGSNDIKPVGVTVDKGDREAIECKKCGTVGPLGKTELKAVALWNKRVTGGAR